MLKIIGICILLFTIFSISSSACKKERERISLLFEMTKFLREVRHTLTVSMKPMSEITYLFKTDEPYFSELMKDGFSLLSDEAEVGRLKSMIGGAADVFVGFISGFGRGYLSEEIKRCDSAIEKLDGIYEEEKSAASRRLRVCRTLGVASSFALVILFI